MDKVREREKNILFVVECYDVTHADGYSRYFSLHVD
jgi:hypothetical protein